MAKKILLVLGLWLALLFVLEQAAGTKIVLADTLCSGHQETLSFADHLFQEKEYYRAIGEYLRFHFFCPAEPTATYAFFQIGLAYYLGGRYEEAIHQLDRFQKDYPESEQIVRSFFLQSRSYLYLNDFENNRKKLAYAHRIELDRNKQKRLQVSFIWSYLRERNWSYASELARTGDPTPPPSWIVDFYSSAQESTAIPRKHPALASVLSALLPGSGHAYCERYRDAVTALVVNSLLIWGTRQALRNENDELTILFGGLEFFFYSGTVLSAYSSTLKYNKRQQDLWLRSMEQGYPLDSWDEKW